MVSSGRWLRLALIAGAALLLYLPGLGRPALWEPDEGRYAEIAREMYLSGDYVTPRNDQVRYFEKPPLVYWAEAGCLALFGPGEFAVRLPAALFSAGEVAVTAALAEVMFGPQAAILSAVALGLSPLAAGFARFATLDPALSFFMTAALACFYLAARARGFAGGAARRWLIAAAAMLALGTLAKGPVALVLGGAIALGWLVAEGRGREIPRIPWISLALVYCAIVTPWFVLAAERNPGFLRFFFVHEHLQRYLVNTEHGWGPWFFVPVAVGGTWPWFFFVPFGVGSLARKEGGRPALRFLLIWFLLIFGFFSIPRAKLGSYILPALPALAILSGFGLARLWTAGADTVHRRLRWFLALNSALALAAAAGAIALGAGWFAAVRPGRGLAHGLAADGLMLAVLLGAAGALAFALNRFGRRPAASVTVLALGMVLIMGIAARARQHAAPLSTYRNLARSAARYLRPGCVLASYRHNVQSLPFYTGFREALVAYRGELAPFGGSPDASPSFISTDQELAALWRRPGACVVVAVNRRDLPALAGMLAPAPVIIGCEGKKAALYNGPDGRPAPGCGAAADE